MEYVEEIKRYIRDTEKRIADIKVSLRESAMYLKNNSEDELAAWLKDEYRDQLNCNERHLKMLIKERLSLKDYYG